MFRDRIFIVLVLAAIAGCGSGSGGGSSGGTAPGSTAPPPPGWPSPPPGLPGPGGPTSPPPGVPASTAGGLHAVAFDESLVFGTGGPPPLLEFWVATVTTVTNARLMVDLGQGFVDTGAPPPVPVSGGFVFAVPPIPASFQVLADGAGTSVSSNVITVSPPTNLGAVALVSPATATDPSTAPVVQPAGATWTANGSARFLVILSRGQGPEWVAETDRASYDWGGGAAFTYQSGSNPLAGGSTWLIAVLGLDRTGWATATTAAQVPSPLWPALAPLAFRTP